MRPKIESTFAGIYEWAKRHCDSNGAEDLEDRNKLIVHKNIKSNPDAMIFIAVKSMLKLLQNESTKLSSDATHGTAWNH